MQNCLVFDKREAGKKESSFAAGLYGVHAIPTLFLIAPDGIMIGKIEHEDLDGTLEKLMN